MPDMQEVQAEEPVTETQVTNDDPIDAAVAAMEKQPEPEGESQESTEEVEAKDSKEDEAKAEEVEEEKPEKESKLLAIARQEERLREERDAFKQTQEEFKQEQQEALEQVATFNKAVKSGSWVKVLESLGVKDFAAVAEELYVHELGDDVPPEMRLDQKTVNLSKKYEEMQERLDSYEKKSQERVETQQAEQQVAQYVSALDTHLGKLDSKDYPHLSIEIEDDKQGTVEAMWDVANAIWENTKEVPTPEMVADELEASLSKIAKKYESLYKPQKAAEPEKKVMASKTISNKDSSKRASLKGPPDIDDDDELAARALAAMESAG